MSVDFLRFDLCIEALLACEMTASTVIWKTFCSGQEYLQLSHENIAGMQKIEKMTSTFFMEKLKCGICLALKFSYFSKLPFLSLFQRVNYGFCRQYLSL